MFSYDIDAKQTERNNVYSYPITNTEFPKLFRIPGITYRIHDAYIMIKVNGNYELIN